MGDETGNEMRKVTFWFAVAAYLATGILQPTLTDLIRYHGGKGRVTSWYVLVEYSTYVYPW